MHFCHVSAIWEQFPQLVPSILLVEGIAPNIDIEADLQPWFQRARQRLAGNTESQLPEVAAWRRVYAEMGLKPTKYRSAAEALLRRFRREDDLPRLHPLVDLCNAVSLAFALPIAVFDLDHVASFLEVRPAGGTERYLSFGNETETPPPGEIIFADAEDNVHARRWTFRQSRLSTISPETKRVLIVSEAMHASAAQDEAALLKALTSGINAHWTTPNRQAILSAANPKFDF